MKRAIIAATYGSNSLEVFEKSIEPFTNALAAGFPGCEVRMAFTGKRAREMMKKQGMCADSVEEVLQDLADKGYDEVAIQPSHIIAGDEFDSICDAANKYFSSFKRIVVGAPLLGSPEDIKTICHMLYDEMATDDNEIVLMGHGTDHSANHVYGDFNNVCRDMGYVHMHTATLESSPGLDDLLPVLSASGRNRITLAPLLFSAGAHACRDMAGDSPESWRSRLTAKGFDVTTVLRGLGEYDTVRNLYVSHLTDSLATKL